MLNRLSASVLLVLATSCSADQAPKTSKASSSQPSAAGQPISASQPVKQPAKEAPVPASDMQWSVNFADGSGNQYTVTSASGDSEARLVYSPVTPAESSSGTYSGGAPADVQISAEKTSEMWRRIRTLESDTARHTKARSMGSGSFRTKTSVGESSFLMSMGAELSDFTSFMASLRPAE